MDPMVSARVPAELRDRVNRELRAMNSSPTELINKAYEFFLATKTLPQAVTPPAAGRRQLDKRRQEELLQSIAESTVAVPESYFGDKSYKQLLEESLAESYAALD